MSPRSWAPFLVAILGLLAGLAAAEIDHIEITHRETVADGFSFGSSGPYEKLVGKAHFSLDPDHPANLRIVDLAKARRDADGRVRFAADLYILKPTDAARGNGAAFLEVSNRGSKAIVRYFNRGATRTFDPTSLEDFGDGFLMRQGYSLVWVGWQFDVPEEQHFLRLEPVFTEAGFEGLVRADHVFSEPAQVLPLGHRGHLIYPAANPSDPRNVLTVRDSRLGDREVIPRLDWQFAGVDDSETVEDPTSIYLASGFEAGRIYEAVYVARRPAVVGLGLAAVRDLASHLKQDETSPTKVDRVLGIGISQTGRFLRQFLYQGFNGDVQGRRAFDGLIVHTAGAGRGSFNHRFGQPSRDGHPYSAFFYPTDIFPFTGASQLDSETEIQDGLFEIMSGMDPQVFPKIFFTNSGYEYWGRAASLIHTSIDGLSDQALDPKVRAFHFASAQHFVDRFPPQPNDTRYAANPVNFLWSLRALLLALDRWVVEGAEPPPSRHPRRDDSTLVPPTELAFPSLPGVRVPRRAHEAYRVDYGPRFRTQGLVDIQPPEIGAPFPAQVSQVDADGNEIGGLRLPQITVPVATYTPWNWRAEDMGAPDELANFRGSFIPFAPDQTAREAAGDPRLSIEERYPSREAYLVAYTEAALDLIKQGYLLAEDLSEMIEYAGELWDLVVQP